MMKRISVSALAFLVAVVFAPGIQAKPANSIKVTKGSVLLDGIRIPVFQGVVAVNRTGQESVYAGGIGYVLKTKNQKASLKLAAKVIKFYRNKKISATHITGFDEYKPGDGGVYYNSMGKDSTKGKKISISIYAGKDRVDVIIVPSG